MPCRGIYKKVEIFPETVASKYSDAFQKKPNMLLALKKMKIIVHGENLGSKKDDSESTKLQKRFLLPPNDWCQSAHFIAPMPFGSCTVLVPLTK